MEEFLNYLIKQIVTKPEEVKIEKRKKTASYFLRLEWQKKIGVVLSAAGATLSTLCAIF